MKKYYCDAKDLANYIAKKYSSEKNVEISPLKLQKSLYFCFAHWGGMVAKGMKQKQVEVQIDYSPYLFENKIEAWVYGPVVPDVYAEQEEIRVFKGNLELAKEIQDFIDDLCNDIFPLSDFKLVELSHMDKSWKNNFNPNDKIHDREIIKDEIIEEYATF